MTVGGGGPSVARAAALRGIVFFAFWVVLSGGKPADLPVGFFTAAVATLASLRLLPPSTGGLRPLAVAQLVWRFFRQSVVAGIDVARRALDPRLPLRPGFVSFSTRLPEGPGRSAFASLMSLLPGSLPVGDDDSAGMLIHCLDIGQPIAAQLAAEEAVFMRAVGGDRSDD